MLSPLRCVLGYFTNTPLEQIPNVAIPLHTLIELRPKPDGTMEVRDEWMGGMLTSRHPAVQRSTRSLS